MIRDKILIHIFPHLGGISKGGGKQRYTIEELSIVLNSLVERGDLTEDQAETLINTGQVIIPWDTGDAEFGIIRNWCIMQIKDEHEA